MSVTTIRSRPTGTVAGPAGLPAVLDSARHGRTGSRRRPMGEFIELPLLPEGWSWEGPAGPEVTWLRSGFLEDLVDGPLPDSFTETTWILHAQFVRPADMPPEPEPVDREEMPGCGFGVHAPEGWQRIAWAEAAARKGVPLRGPAARDGLEIPPCDRWDALLNDSDAAKGVQPPHVTPRDFFWPTEGSLGKTDLDELVPVLAARCTCAHNPKHAYYSCSRMGIRCVRGNREGCAQRTGRTFFVPMLRSCVRESPRHGPRLSACTP